ncbi:MAG: redoxin domain-containing protein [Patescibacteria group bacterium]|jgi:peroxiredoxin (alkyl hydroperoxide reductase subunit C)
MENEIMVDDPCDCLPEPMIGKKLPDIGLKAYHEGGEKSIKLADYRGKWMVLIFYPADFTFICPTELEEAAEYYDQFQKEGAEVFSISTDTVYVHKAWHDQSPSIKKIKFPMLADPAGKLSRLLGVYLEDEGLALRGSFIVDPEGVIKAIEVHDNSIGRSAAELLRKLQAAKLVYDNDGAIVCPANWHKGGKTLKPGMDLVGKI